MKRVELDERYDTPPSTTVYDGTGLGQVIRMRRKELGVTQADLARMVGVSERLLCELERGRDTVGVGKVIWICNNIGIDVTLRVRGK